ncbi:MAG: hypothetical protein R2881_01360 [Eubacteriales bacterium]
MIHSDSISASTERATSGKRLLRTLAALLALALALTLAGCDLLKDRSATELTIEDATQIDIEDLVKYEELQLLDLRKADVSLDQYQSVQSALPNCTILWSVPIANHRFDNQVTQLTLVRRDRRNFGFAALFPKPEFSRCVRSCTCYDALVKGEPGA